MAFDIPDSPDTYTTTYKDFKGVDMTNDPSNIWKYRMADGLNMAPDEAGQPWKRAGWEISVSKDTIESTYSEATGVASCSVDIVRLYSFELNSEDHIACVADVTAEGETKNGTVFMLRKDADQNDIMTVLLDTDGDILKIDANRSFFFEGNGTAGFYMFKTATASDPTSVVNNMYIYTYEDSEYVTRLADIYIPTTIIARSPTGGDGTLLEDANMLTNLRRVTFYGDGSSKTYSLPTGSSSSDGISVSMLSSEGEWKDIPKTDSTYPWKSDYPYASVVFTADAPPVSPITGEDNIAIVYESTGYNVTSSSNSAELTCKTESLMKATKTRSRTQTYTYTFSPLDVYIDSYTIGTYGSEGAYSYYIVYQIRSYINWSVAYTTDGDWSGWESTESQASGIATGSCSLSGTENLKVYKRKDSEWVEMGNTEYTTNYDAYSNTLNVTLVADLDADCTETESTSSTSEYYGTLSSLDDSNAPLLYYSSYVEVDSDFVFSTESAAKSAANTAVRNITGVVNAAKASSNSEAEDCIGGISDPLYGVFINAGNSWNYSGTGYLTATQPQYQQQGVTVVKSYRVKAESSSVEIETETKTVGEGMTAFAKCKRATLFGSGLLNSVFMTGSTSTAYTSRVWYSGVGDPTYFPDTNYIEVGSNDTDIMGMVRVGEYLGIIKQGASMDATIYLAYPTSYDDNTTYAVKQSITGVGAVSNGAFNILSDEALFLSKEGIVAITPDDSDRQVKNRSYFLNKSIMQEDYLNRAISFVYEGMYILCVPRLSNSTWTGVCYVLDGSQKTSWANEKTNLQYEGYYWENVPSKCFAKYEDLLWFADFRGNLCRFKPANHSYAYHDAYNLTSEYTASTTSTSSTVELVQDEYPIKFLKFSDVLSIPMAFAADFEFQAGDGVSYRKMSWVAPRGSTKQRLMFGNKPVLTVTRSGINYTYEWEDESCKEIITLENPEDETLREFLFGVSGNTSLVSIAKEDFYYYDGWKIIDLSIETSGVTVDKDKFLTMIHTAGEYQFVKDGDNWTLEGEVVDLSVLGITYEGSPSTITVDVLTTPISLEDYGIYVTGLTSTGDKIAIEDGVPIEARMATISDNDGATEYFKNMLKKGVVVSLLPKKSTGGTVYIKADEKDSVMVNITKGVDSVLPSDIFVKKKIKKYKRLQFIVENNNFDETFGVDSITKTYTLGNYSKNRKVT